MNFTASYLDSKKKRIYDELGNEIFTIGYDSLRYPFKITKPCISYNILQTKETEKTPIITTIKTVKEIEDKGFILCSVPLTKSQKWTNYNTMVALFRKGSYPEHLYKRLTGLKDVAGIKVEYDEANLRIRVVGPKAGPTGEGPWLLL